MKTGAEGGQYIIRMVNKWNIVTKIPLDSPVQDIFTKKGAEGCKKGAMAFSFSCSPEH